MSLCRITFYEQGKEVAKTILEDDVYRLQNHDIEKKNHLL
jgi:hypothetical protein